MCFVIRFFTVYKAIEVSIYKLLVERGSPLSELNDAKALLRDASVQHVLPASTDLLLVILSALATSCAAERTFSQLRRM